MRTFVHWRSLQTRLLLGALVWISVGMAGSGIVVSALFKEHVTNQFTHELNDHLTELENLYVPGPPDGLIRPVSDPRFSLPGSGYYWQIVRGGAPSLRSPSLETRTLRPAPSRDQPLRGAIDGSAERLIVIERARVDARSTTGARFMVAGDEAELRRTISAFNGLLSGSLAIVGLGLGVAAVAQVRIGLRPLRRLQAGLSQVRSGESDALPGDFPHEVQPLVSELNAVIQANGDMVRRARAQAGNLGHALRTHLAILTERARSLSVAGQPEAGAAILAECQAISRQVDYQVARARAAAPRAVVGAMVSPSAVAGDILSALGKLHRDRTLALTNDIAPDLAIACDPDDLYEMMANLADNAFKWARTEVRLQSEVADLMVRLIAEDDGPGVPEAQWSEAFQLGVKLDEQVPGGGLGLTIVRDLAELYGGDVSLGRSELGGARVVLQLPKGSDSSAA